MKKLTEIKTKKINYYVGMLINVSITKEYKISVNVYEVC